VVSGLTAGESLAIVPTRSYGDGRVCVNRAGCVCSPRPAVLSRFNPGAKCFACEIRDRRLERAEREPSTAELMSERRAVAA
jgi:hypothetical protein